MTEDHRVVDVHVPTTLYRPLHPLELPHISTSKNVEKSQPITESEKSETNDNSRQPGHTVIPDITPTHTPEVTSPLASLTTHHTNPNTRQQRCSAFNQN